MFSILTVLLGLVYVLWVASTLNYRFPLLARSFLFAEIVCLGLFIVATVDVWRLRFASPEGLDVDRPYSVDVLITAHSEAESVVRRTLEAVAQIRWRGELQVYVLDDGGSSRVREFAEALGFHYRSRRDKNLPQDDAKGGNLNFGLGESRGELILVLDADQIPQPQILEVLAGYMRFPRVAFVQSKQSFQVPKDDPFDSRDPVFYDAVQLGFNGNDSVISCGSGVLYRRAAIEELGGFATWNLVEDLTTSYELHARGWKSFYHPYALSVGLGPEDIWDVYQQRGQWALDTMRLFVWDNPLFKKGLGWRRRLDYFVVGLSYVCAAFVFPFFFAVPLWSYLTGHNILSHHELEFVLYRGAYFVAMAIALRYLYRNQGPGKQFRMTLAGLFPVYAIATVRALFYPPGRKPGYRANNAARKPRKHPPWLAVLPQTALLTANIMLPFYAIWFDTAVPRLVAANALISAVAIWSLWQVVAAALSPSAKAGAPP